MFNLRSIGEWMPSRRQLRSYADYDLDDVLKAVGLERRNVWMDVLGYSAIFLGGAVVGSVLAAFFAPKDLTERASKVAREYGTEFNRQTGGQTGEVGAESRQNV